EATDTATFVVNLERVWHSEREQYCVKWPPSACKSPESDPILLFFLKTIPPINSAPIVMLIAHKKVAIASLLANRQLQYMQSPLFDLRGEFSLAACRQYWICFNCNDSEALRQI